MASVYTSCAKKSHFLPQDVYTEAKKGPFFVFKTGEKRHKKGNSFPPKKALFWPLNTPSGSKRASFESRWGIERPKKGLFSSPLKKRALFRGAPSKNRPKPAKKTDALRQVLLHLPALKASDPVKEFAFMRRYPLCFASFCRNAETSRVVAKRQKSVPKINKTYFTAGSAKN